MAYYIVLQKKYHKKIEYITDPDPPKKVTVIFQSYIIYNVAAL